MPSLFFNYGTMNSSKTANLLMTAHTLRGQGKNVVLVKPSADTRDGARMINSRVGLKAVADIVLLPNNFPLSICCEEKHVTELKSLCEQYGNSLPKGKESLISNADIVLVDEAQFLSVRNVEKLRQMASEYGTPIVCYGLLTDYKSKLFPGSKRLVELADQLKEITYDVSPSVGDCCWCKTDKAIINSKFIERDGELEIIKEGSSLPDLGAEEKYKPLCWSCWNKT